MCTLFCIRLPNFVQIAYNSTLSSLLDRHAPIRLRRVSARRSEPWFDSECRAAKRKTRRLERLYRRRRRRRHDPPVPDVWKTQFQRQRRLFRCKAAEYWKTTIADCRDDVRLLWSKLSRLLEPSTSAQQLHTASDLATHFTTKVCKVRQSTAAAAPPVIHERHRRHCRHYSR